jgi:hypothetical protein
VWLSSPHLYGLTTEQARSRLTSLLCKMWRYDPAPLADSRPALFMAVDDAWTAYKQYSSPPYPRPVAYLPPAVILALLEVRDVKKVSRQSESVRLELLCDQYALCLLSLFEDAILAIPDG